MSPRLFAAAFVAVAAVLTPVVAADVNLIGPAGAGQSWATAALWSDGTAASAGNHYFTNGYTLRTPDTATGSATFPGASLTINGGDGGARGTLTLKAGTTTIGDLQIGAGTISNGVAGGSGNLPATLNVTNFTVQAAAMSSSAAIIQGAFTGNNLTLNVTNLLGEGFLQFGGARNYSLSVANASAFTGTLNLSQGSLTIATDLGMGSGAFTMATGASLILGNDLRVSSLSFGGTVATSGIYTSGELNSFFSTSAFSGDGLVYVSVIPEPSSFAFGVGALAFGLVGLRRAKRAA